jgi:magnesium transporter
MLSFHSTAAKGEIAVAPDARTIPHDVNCIDAVRPDAREIAFLERSLGIEVPTLEALSEIECQAGCAPRRTGFISAFP